MDLNLQELNQTEFRSPLNWRQYRDHQPEPTVQLGTAQFDVADAFRSGLLRD